MAMHGHASIKFFRANPAERPKPTDAATMKKKPMRFTMVLNNCAQIVRLAWSS